MKWLVLIPSFNTGPDLLLRTVKSALDHAPEVWVVIDGSTDASPAALQAFAAEMPRLKVVQLPQNQGKGAALLHGVKASKDAGFSHVLTMDADGQHPADQIPSYVALAQRYPEAVMIGVPTFGPEAPSVRVQGRKISNFFVHVETLGWGVGDCLFGMRMYPCEALLRAFAKTAFARRFDFDAEIAVRLAWLGVPMLNVPTPVRYLTKDEGGISQFRYGRDNALLTWMHARLMIGAMLRFPFTLWRRLTRPTPPCL